MPEFKESEKSRTERISKAKEEYAASQTAVTSDPKLYFGTLNIMSEFPYSPSDILYLAYSRQSISELDTFEGWNKKGYRIDKGEKGLTLLDYNNGEKVYFDVSQTTAPNPERKSDLRLPNEKLNALLSNKVRLMSATKEEYTRGLPVYFDTKYNAIIRNRNSSLSTEDLLPVLSKEIAHAYLFKKLGSEYNRQDCEITANAVSYVICKKNNTDCPLPEFPSEYTPEMFKTHLDNVRLIADEIQDNIQFYYDNGKAQFERPKPLQKAENNKEEIKQETKDETAKPKTVTKDKKPDKSKKTVRGILSEKKNSIMKKVQGYSPKHIAKDVPTKGGK